MKIYLDTCCYNRPFDDNNPISVNLETFSVLDIQENIKSGKYSLVWSFILDYENHMNPSLDNKESIQSWESNAKSFCSYSEKILRLSEKIRESGVHQRDALHVACAITCECEYFITTDYNLLKKGNKIKKINIINPIDFVRLMEGKNAI